jgi:hypothetical protein
MRFRIPGYSPLCDRRRRACLGYLGDSVWRWKLLRRFADFSIDTAELLGSMTAHGKLDDKSVYCNTMTLKVYIKR